MDKFIKVYPYAMEKDYCETVIKNFEEVNNKTLTWTRQESENVHPNLKKDTSYELTIGIGNIVAGNCDARELFRINQNLASDFHDFFKPVFTAYLEEFGILTSPSVKLSVSHVKVQKTKPGEGYHAWHCEDLALDSCDRILAFSCYLNDDFEGGETEYLYAEQRIPAQQGTVCIFPANFCYAHRGNPPIKGTKYILTGWVELVP